MDPRSPDRTNPDFIPDRDTLQRPGAGRAAAPRVSYVVETRTAAEMAAEIGAWRELAQRAVEANVFAEPELVLPGIQHLPEGRGVVLLLVWEGVASTAEGGALRGVFPIVTPRLGMTRQIRVWSPAPGSAGIPLVDRKAPAEVIEAALTFLGAKFARFAGLTFSHVPTDGAFASALRTAAVRTRRDLQPAETFRRHVLVNATAERDLDAVRRRIVDDLRDGRQRLSALGNVEMDHARTARWVRDAVEELLVLDAAGVAGRRGNALLQTAGMASFLRIATRQLAQSGRCRVDLLRVDGRAVAAAIVLESDRQAWLWQIASDASLAAMEPEAQLALDMTRTQMDRPGLARTEACAGCASPVIAALWQEKVAADYVIGIRPQSSPATLAARIGEGFRRGLRSVTKDPLSGPARSWRMERAMPGVSSASARPGAAGKRR
jgi:CelD/BcsL family acetyltransferase involved in cellulose biosynthesis